jgi:signal transduction histidine kinase
VLPVRHLGIRAKIIGISLLTLGGVLIAVAAFDASSDADLVQESRRAAQDLTDAMQVSVQQLGRTMKPDEDLLRDYARRLGRTGIKQITVLSPEKRPLAWTGRQPPHAFLIEEQPKGQDAPSTWDLLVPIIIGANKLGYIQLRMTSQSFEDLLSSIRRERTLFTAFAFIAGLALAWLLATQIAGPVEALRVAAQRVSKGDLEVTLPKAPHDEVGQLVNSFSEMVRGLKERKELELELERAERDALLGRMAATIAHDVRNPLNYLSLAVDHLLSAGATPEAEKIGAQMKSELARANQRIAEFLRLGKPVEIHPQPILVKSLLEAVARSAQTPEHPIRVHADDSGTAEWDPSVVEGILRNLVTNAIQASPDHAGVDLRTEQGEDPGATIRVHVEDRGVGLSDEVIDKMFEPWFTTKESGVGLGLALARRAAEEHGGRLRAEKREGGGARFTLELPRIARKAEKPESEAKA